MNDTVNIYAPANFHISECRNNKKEIELVLCADAPTSNEVAILVFAVYANSVMFGQEVFPVQRVEMLVHPGQIRVTTTVTVEQSGSFVLECFALKKNGRLLTDSSGTLLGFADSINFVGR